MGSHRGECLGLESTLRMGWGLESYSQRALQHRRRLVLRLSTGVAQLRVQGMRGIHGSA